MAHWSDYSLRGWLSFLAFMHVGLCLRSYFDSNFLFTKIYKLDTVRKEMLIVHYFVLHSLIQAFVLIQSAIHLYVLPAQIITMFLLLTFILLNLFEAFYFQTLDFYGGTLLPFTMSVISFIWLILFNFIWKPWIFNEIQENKMKKFLLQQGALIKRQQQQQQQQQHQQNNAKHFQSRTPPFGYNLIIKPKQNQPTTSISSDTMKPLSNIKFHAD